MITERTRNALLRNKRAKLKKLREAVKKRRQSRGGTVIQELIADGAKILKQGYNPLSGKFITPTQKTTFQMRLEVLKNGN